jgi:hypothetical protein
MAGRTTAEKQYREGPAAAHRFERTLGRILRVDKEELARREAAYQKYRSTRDRPGPRRRKG